MVRLGPGCRAGRCGRSPGRPTTPSAPECRAPVASHGFSTDPPEMQGGESCAFEKLGEIVDDDIGAVLSQCLALTDSIHSNNATKTAGTTRFNARQCVFEHSSFRRLHLQETGRGEIRIWRWLASEVLAVGHDSVNNCFK